MYYLYMMKTVVSLTFQFNLAELVFVNYILHVLDPFNCLYLDNY